MKRLLTIARLMLISLPAISAFATAPDITATDPPPSGTVGEAYLYDFDIDLTASTVGFQNLPPGLNFDPTDYKLSGTPTEAGTFDTVIYARNLADEETRITRSIVIAAAPIPPDFVPPTIAITNVVVTKLGVNKYNFDFYFPVGLECSAFEFEVRAVDRAGNRSVAANYKFQAPGSSTKPAITSTASAKGKAGKLFTYRIEADGATRYTASGLPPGLKLDAKTGVISGKPKKVGTFGVDITAGNSVGTAKKTLRIKIARR
jgi:hypothetical protein